MRRYRLTAEREKRGLTAEQLGKVLGISKAMVSHIETGRHWPSGKVIVELERFFNMPAIELLEESSASNLQLNFNISPGP